MPKITHPNASEAIVLALKTLPDGASIVDMERALQAMSPPVKLLHRTLQRRLAELVATGSLRIEGVGRGIRYYVTMKEPVTDVTSAPKIVLPISTVSAAIRASVRGPIQSRKPVGYNRSFLDGYRPNETAYLSASMRKRLAAAGAVPGGERPAGTYARQILNRLLIDLSWNSSRLEGNTYSLLETERLLQFGENAEGKNATDAQMILNHKAAIEMLVDNAASIGFNRFTVLNLHGLLADNLLDDPGAVGRTRSIAVDISGTVFHPLEGPQLVEECFNKLLATAAAIRDPFEQSFFAMVHLPYMQPFEDVNKRVSRLAANIPLIRFNLCPLSFVDVPPRDYVDGILGIYELNRIELLRDVFIWAYERSCERYAAVRRSRGEPDLFKLRYRTVLKHIVGHVVRSAMIPEAGGQFIRDEAHAVPTGDQAQLIEAAETELQSLHEGNFARYRVTPSEFEAWQKAWL